MLSKAFGFQGRMARLAFLGWLLGAWLAVLLGMAVFAVLAGVVLAAIGAGQAAMNETGTLVDVTCGVIMTWTAMALTAKRARDMGLSPLLVVGGIWGFALLDALVAVSADVGLASPFQYTTIVGAVVAVAYTAALLLWPSADNERGFARA